MAPTSAQMATLRFLITSKFIPRHKQNQKKTTQQTPMRGIKTSSNEITSNIRHKHSPQNLHLKVRRYRPRKHIVVKVQKTNYIHTFVTSRNLWNLERQPSFVKQLRSLKCDNLIRQKYITNRARVAVVSEAGLASTDRSYSGARVAELAEWSVFISLRSTPSWQSGSFN